MPECRFSLQRHLESLYAETPRRFAFRATTPEEFRSWKDAFRGELTQLLEVVLPEVKLMIADAHQVEIHQVQALHMVHK